MVRKINYCVNKKIPKSVNIGASNRLNNDVCEVKRSIVESVSPGDYRIYPPYGENCGKCVYKNKFYMKNDVEVVDTESELKNITRPNTRCPELKYNPKCKKSKMCVNTFDPSNPIIPSPEVCPPVSNNNYKPTHKGFLDYAFMKCSGKFVR